MKIILRENPLDKAARLIREYCLKREDCIGCRFSAVGGRCILCRDVPCDWKIGGWHDEKCD